MPHTGTPPTGPISITDPADPRIADFIGLRDPELRRATEARTGRFIAEGRTVLERLIETGWPLCAVLLEERRSTELAALLGPVTVPIYVAPRALLAQISGFDVHRGILACAQRPAERSWAEVVPATGRLVIAEGLTDQVNLGSIFRSSAALGVDALLGAPGICDPLYRRTVRVSMGAVFRLPFAVAEPWPAVLGELAARDWSIVALTPGGDQSLDELEAELRAAPRVAVLVGAEGDGLRPETLAAATHRMCIPMAAGIDSLNAAVATAVAVHSLRPAWSAALLDVDDGKAEPPLQAGR